MRCIYVQYEYIRDILVKTGKAQDSIYDYSSSSKVCVYSIQVRLSTQERHLACFWEVQILSVLMRPPNKSDRNKESESYK